MSTESLPLGVNVMPLETRRSAILHLATRADELGYQAFTLPETWSYDATLMLTEIATRTQHIRLCASILGVWGRSAAQIAMAAATLNMISDGRFILGLGSSTKQLTEGLHDVAYEAPYRKVRQTIRQVRALLQGERAPLTRTSETRALRLNLPPQKDLPILLAASSDESIRIAGELCDGWVPFLFPRDRLADGIALLRAGAARAGKAEEAFHVYPGIPTVVSDDTATAREGAAWFVAFYLLQMGPLYRQLLTRMGFDRAVAAVLAANADGQAAIVPPEAEILLEQLTIYGTPEQARRQLAQWYAAGADMPVLALRPNLSASEADFVLQTFRSQPRTNR